RVIDIKSEWPNAEPSTTIRGSDMRSHRPTTNSCPNRATVDRRVSSRTMCFDLTTHSQMLSCEDCTIRVVQDQSPDPFVRNIVCLRLAGAFAKFQTAPLHRRHTLIFYAGHGYWDRERSQGYWLPSDAQNGNHSNWISNGDIRDAIRAIAAH